MFEIVNVENGLVLKDEIPDKFDAIKWASAWSDENDYDYVQVNVIDKLVTVHKIKEQDAREDD